MPDEYSTPALPSADALAAALATDDAPALQEMVIAVTLRGDDVEGAERLALRLSAHRDEFVRGNAVLGLGHLARRTRTLRAESLAAMGAALEDPSEYVRGQAEAAASDAEHFLTADLPRPWPA